ncbi:outer membrane beta-barrel protein [Tenacibaculum sp. IMCC1]|uniref:Outer membrane protein beta-barrel domain-containing protein n=1 Tax=Tenacibaculum sp. Pbs-1 TaxID=3238748 RepID=A0AB33KXV9_9FLAO
MKYKLLLILLLCGIGSFSQNKKISLEVSYPLTIDNNFIGGRSKGVVDLGIKYRIKDFKIVNLGIGINGGLLVDDTDKSNNYPQDFERTIYAIQPKIFSELNLSQLTKLHLFVNIGYSFMKMKLTNNNNSGPVDFSKLSDTLRGINAGLGVSYDILPRIFLQAQYDFSKLNSGNSPDVDYNTNVNLLKMGIGIRL